MQTNKETGTLEELAEKLKPKMRKFAYFMASPDSLTTKVADICRQFKISKDTYYKWLRDVDRIAVTDALIEEFKAANNADAWNALMHLCRMGNVKAIKLYFELTRQAERAGTDMVIRVSLHDGDYEE